MKLKTAQIKAFRTASASIKQNGILPILSYLKFDNGFITKNNMESFVIMPADFDGSCLIDEVRLYGFIDNIKASEFEVKIKDGIVTLSDGKYKQNSPTDLVSNFPVNVIPDADEIELTNTDMWAIKYASNFTQEDEINPYMKCVFIGNGIIAATNSFIAYTEKTELKNTIILQKETAAAIGKYESVLFSENESYQFFKCNEIKYGFIKKDTKFLDMKIFSVLPDGPGVALNKDEIINFCSMCVASTPTGATLEVNIKGGCLVMLYPAHNIDISTSIDLPVTETLQDFRFQPFLMLKMLKNVPDTDLIFYRGKDKYFITGESGFVALIMEMK